MDAPGKLSPQRFRFADLTLDTGQICVLRGTDTIRLSKLSFEMLRVLVEAAPNVVSHAELCEKVWGSGRVVTPENLAKRVMMLRQALGDHADEPRYVEGVRGHGYRLIPVVEFEPLQERSAARANTRGRQTSARSLATHASDARQGIGLRRKLSYVVGAITLVSLGLFGLSQFSDLDTTASSRRSLAVLPFDNLSLDPDQEYFVDGLSEELINQLTQIENLRVAGRTSSFAYRGRATELRSISETLGVEYVLIGSVRRAVNELRITAQLVSVANGSNVWSRTFSGDLSDVFELQNEIAVAVSQELSLELGIGKPALEYAGTDIFEAYDRYLRGFALQNVAVDQAIEEFKGAVAIDPNFARAWAGLAYVYGVLLRAATSHEAERDALELMEYAARQAVELAPEHWDGYSALAWVDVAKKDWHSANQRIEQVRKLARQSGSLIDLPTYSNFLHQIGRVEEALVENEAVRRLDPLDTFASFNIQIDLMLLGRYREAIAEYERNRELPGIQSAMHTWAIPWFIEQGDHDAVEKGFERFSAGVFQQLADVWQSRDDALAVIRGALVAPGYHSRNVYSVLAIFAAHYEDYELAVSLLRDAYLSGGYAGFFLIWHPIFSEARRTESFKRFVRDLGFVELWRSTGNWGDYCHPTNGSDFECA